MSQEISVSAAHTVFTRLLHYLYISHESPDNGLPGLKYVLNEIIKTFVCAMELFVTTDGQNTSKEYFLVHHDDF
jgi:hypothetical protein